MAHGYGSMRVVAPSTEAANLLVHPTEPRPATQGVGQACDQTKLAAIVAALECTGTPATEWSV